MPQPEDQNYEDEGDHHRDRDNAHLHPCLSGGELGLLPLRAVLAGSFARDPRTVYLCRQSEQAYLPPKEPLFIENFTLGYLLSLHYQALRVVWKRTGL